MTPQMPLMMMLEAPRVKNILLMMKEIQLMNACIVYLQRA